MQFCICLPVSPQIPQNPDDRSAAAGYPYDANAAVVFLPFEGRSVAVNSYHGNQMSALHQFAAKCLNESADSPVGRGRIFRTCERDVQNTLDHRGATPYQPYPVLSGGVFLTRRNRTTGLPNILNSTIFLPLLAQPYRRLYSGINYRLRSAGGGRLASFCRPVSIGLLLTERCNARCVHCDIWKNRGQEDSPSVEQWKELLRDLREWLGPVHVVFSGGEALLRAYTTDLVKFGSSLGLFIETLTHGYWMEQSRIEKLARARPGRITLSVDGIGTAHSLIRGREKFWEYTEASLQTLLRLRREEDLDYSLRLKTVVMNQNLDQLGRIAGYATANGMDVFYQPVEQNYNTTEDARWFDSSVTWPRDTKEAVRRVEELIRLKQGGSPIANSLAQLQAMISYFEDPDGMRVRVQGHAGHEARPLCGALTTIQIQSNGDVSTCCACVPAGNIRQQPIRDIWEARPDWWNGGCCLERRCSEAEKRTAGLVIVSR